MRCARVVGALLLLLAGGALGGVHALSVDGLEAREVRRLERARDVHQSNVDRAAEIYRRTVERANTTLARIYEPIIEQYAARGEEAIATDLRDDLMTRCRSALAVPDSDAPNTSGHTQLIQQLGPFLVDSRGEQFGTDILARADYVALYFSAGWCGPCKVFTPHLVRFFNQHHQGGKVHVVLVSSDRSEDGMFSYMRNAEMPWLAIPYGHIRDSGIKQRFGVTGIPQLYVLDRDGNVAAASTVNGAYRGASAALADLEKLVRDGAM